MNKLIAIVGMCGSGKSIASDFYEKLGYKKVYFGGVTMDKLRENNLEITPDNERMMREKLRKEHGMAAFAKLLLPKIDELLSNNNVVLDGLYSWDEYIVLNEKYPNIKLIAIIVDKSIRYERLENRKIRPFSKEDAIKRDITEIENLAKAGPIAYADYFILNNKGEKDFLNKLEEITETIEKED